MSNNPQLPLAVDNQTATERLHQLAADPTLTLDVTTLDLSRLPPHVQCTLVSRATEFSVPQLQTSGDIYASRARVFSAPQLQTSGHIDAPSATEFSAPQLQTSGDIDVRSATTFSAPRLPSSSTRRVRHAGLDR
jgi:hypothetical protein